MPKVILMFKSKILNAFPLSAGGSLTIGRHPQNDIVIDNLAVSGHHARIDHQNGQFRLTDLNSKNSTFLNGAAVIQSLLQDKDTIIIGKHTLRADWTDTTVVEPARTENELVTVHPGRTVGFKNASEDQIGQDTLAEPGCDMRPEKDNLSFLSGGEGEFALTQKFTIGKNQDADIVVGGTWTLLMGAPAAIIAKRAGDYFLSYAGGWIRPRRNGKSVRGTVKLKHEDVVDVGPIKVQVRLKEKTRV